MKNNFLHPMHEKVNHLQSYGAILNFIIDNRDTGKSTQFKKRGLIRAIKHKSLMVWCRRHENEIKTAKSEFLNSKFFAVLKADYGDRFKKEDFKIDGNYAYYKKTQFCYFCNVSKAKSDKGIDAENIDTIVYDEFMTDEKKYNYYRGNEVHDFFTIFFTKKRTHADGSQSHIYIYMLGNRESFTNPYYKYFHLPQIPIEFEGVKTFRNGSIAVMQLNNESIKVESDYDKKLLDLIKDTALDKFMHGGVIDAVTKDFKIAPKQAVFYVQFDFGYKLSLRYLNGKIYVNKGLDKKRYVFTDKPNDKYKYNYTCTQRDKVRFTLIEKAYKFNDIYYSDARVYHEFMNVLAFLRIA